MKYKNVTKTLTVNLFDLVLVHLFNCGLCI